MEGLKGDNSRAEGEKSLKELQKSPLRKKLEPERDHRPQLHRRAAAMEVITRALLPL